jgi:hypothetical protein
VICQFLDFRIVLTFLILFDWIRFQVVPTCSCKDAIQIMTEHVSQLIVRENEREELVRSVQLLCEFNNT